MRTIRQRCRSGGDDQGQGWPHDTATHAPNGVGRGGPLDLDTARRRFSDVIRELEMTPEELAALRNVTRSWRDP